MQIVGIRPSNFTGGDGTQVSGQNIYFVYPLERGEGPCHGPHWDLGRRMG